MAFTYHIDAAEPLVVMRFDGVVDIALMADFLETIRSDPERRPDQDCFCDLSGVTEVQLDFSQIMRLASSRADFYRRTRSVRVSVWAPTEMVYGMARMYLAMLEQYEGMTADVFRDRQEAVAFLKDAPQRLERL